MRNIYKKRDDGLFEVVLNRKDGSTLITLLDEFGFKIVEKEDLKLYATYDPKLDGFYVVANTRGTRNSVKKYKLHRLITNAMKGMVVDHINGNTLDNTLGNLRVVSQRINQQNRKNSKDNTSGFRNVRYRKDSDRYQAYISLKGKFISLGSYKTVLEASTVAEKARKRYYEGDVER